LDPEFVSEFDEWLKGWGARSRLGGHRDPFKINAELERSVSEIVSTRRFSFPRELTNRSMGLQNSFSVFHEAVDGNLLTLFRAYVNDTCSRPPGRGLLFNGIKVGLPEVLELLRVDDQVIAHIVGELSMHEEAKQSLCHGFCQSFCRLSMSS
jgi:hypothetical protein